MACENFPDCKFTKPFSQETGLVCPKDGGKIVFKKTKKGRRFYGCSNYPACTFAAWKIEDIKKEQTIIDANAKIVERSEIPDANDHREKIEDIKNPKEAAPKEETPTTPTA